MTTSHCVASNTLAAEVLGWTATTESGSAPQGVAALRATLSAAVLFAYVLLGAPSAVSSLTHASELLRAHTASSSVRSRVR